MAPNGTGGTRLTRGAEKEVIHRVVDLDLEEDAIDPHVSLYLSIRGEWSEKRGYARIEPESSAADNLTQQLARQREPRQSALVALAD